MNRSTILSGLILLLWPVFVIAEVSPLFEAVDKQDPAQVMRLVDAGAGVNEKGKVGFTPLILAAGLENKQIVIYLVNHGADVNARADRGFGVLHRAAMSENPEILRFLITKGLNVNDHGRRYCTPLDFALRMNALQSRGSLENARTLLNHGARKSIDVSCNGYTPLMIAVPDEKVVKFLIDYGADRNIKNRSGQTAYDMAKAQKASSSSLIALLKPQTVNSRVTPEKSLEELTREDGKLMWERKTPENRRQRYSEKEAVAYCENLVWAGYDDYRIPTLDEMRSITTEKPVTDYVIDGVDRYYVDPKRFPNVMPSRHWVEFGDGTMGYFSFSNKRSGYVCTSCIKNFARCVRNSE